MQCIISVASSSILTLLRKAFLWQLLNVYFERFFGLLSGLKYQQTKNTSADQKQNLLTQSQCYPIRVNTVRLMTPKHIHFPRFLSVWSIYLWRNAFLTKTTPLPLVSALVLQLVGGGRRPGAVRLSYGAAAWGGRAPRRLLRPVAAAGRSWLWAEFRQPRQPQGKDVIECRRCSTVKFGRVRMSYDFPMEKLIRVDQCNGRHSWMENSLAIVL